MRKIIIILTAFAMILLTGCSYGDVKTAGEAEFSSEGMSITLTKAFREADFSDFTVCYDSKEIAVFALKEKFSDYEGAEEISLDEYAKIILEANKSKSPEKISETDGLTYMEYEFHNNETNQDFRYFATMFKGPDAFWLIQFSCEKSLYEKNKPYFIKWAKTVEFTDVDYASIL